MLCLYTEQPNKIKINSKTIFTTKHKNKKEKKKKNI